MSGRRTISANSVASFCTWALGSPTGAATAFQISSCSPCTPASARLGTSGATLLRPADVTPIALSLPPLTCAWASPGGSSAICTWPPIRPVMTCGLPG